MAELMKGSAKYHKKTIKKDANPLETQYCARASESAFAACGVAQALWVSLVWREYVGSFRK